MVIASVIASLLHWFQVNFTLENTIFFGTIGTLPAIFWLTFFLTKERRLKKEPKWMISYVFIAGAISALCALVIQLIFKAYTADLINDSSPLQILIFAFIEETFKFLAVYLVVKRSRFFDEPLDGMLDMITGAMGFAAFENILFMMTAPDLAAVGIFRFIGAILLHAIASGFIGFYWIRRKLIRGLVLATLLHVAFNSVILFPEKIVGYSCDTLQSWSVVSSCDLVSQNYDLIANAGVIIAPMLLIFASFFLFRDFDILRAAKEGLQNN